MISVFWNARFDPESPLLMRRDTEFLARPYAEVADMAEDVVKEIVENWLDVHIWCDWFGSDQTDDSGRLVIDISAPAHLAGRYDVDVERVTKARVTKVAAA